MFIFNFIGATSYLHKKNLVGSLNKRLISHQCQYCNYKTNYSTNLKKHILTHTGERPFACALCNYRSSQKTNLKTHLLMKHHRTDDI